MKTEMLRKLSLVGWLLRKGGPYLFLELVMPGGTILAILLFLYQRRVAVANGREPEAVLAVRRVAGSAADWMRANVHPAVSGVRELVRVRATI
jgi:hypothetical protein